MEAQELELKSPLPTQMWPNVICFSMWLPASCSRIVFENLIKSAVIAIISVAWSLWALVSHRLYFLSAEWAEELMNYLEPLCNYYLNFCTPHPPGGRWIRKDYPHNYSYWNPKGKELTGFGSGPTENARQQEECLRVWNLCDEPTARPTRPKRNKALLPNLSPNPKGTQLSKLL